MGCRRWFYVTRTKTAPYNFKSLSYLNGSFCLFRHNPDLMGFDCWDLRNLNSSIARAIED